MARKRFNVLALLVVFSLVLASCGPEATPVPPTATTGTSAVVDTPTTAAMEEPTATTAAMAEATATESDAEPTGTAGMAGGETDYSKVGQELVDAYDGMLTGTKVNMFGPITAVDIVKFNNSVKDFEEATGIDIQYEGSKEFE